MKNNSKILTVILLVLFCSCSYSQNSRDTLMKGFITPPNSSKPRVWWHWMNGNITKDGIAKDLSWMKRVGIGGFMNFDAALGTPQIVEKRLTYMTPDWKDAFHFTAKLADSLHLEMAIAGSPGWSESGGPWVSPADGMKKIVWSETTVSSTSGKFTLEQLTDGDIATTNLLPSDTVHGFAWIQFTFEKPQMIKAITIVGGGDKVPFGLYGEFNDTRSLEVSDDGEHFRKVDYIPAGEIVEQTMTIPETTSKYFRITFKNLPALPGFGAMFGGNPEASKPPAGTNIAEIVLYTSTRINRFEEKAAFAMGTDLASQKTPASSDTIAETDVIDLTGKMNEDGTLNWIPPSGNWNILRFGYSLTGKENHPASPEATGLEVDKLNPKAVKAYFTEYLNQYKDATGGLMGKKGLQYMITDSWEAGTLNWTDKMMIEFKNRRGYDMLPWLPVLTGHIVESAEASDRFLWDFRKTIADLTAENHYDQLTTLLHERGMGRYTESH